MAPTKQNESIVWKHFLKRDKFIAKCKYCKKEIRYSGNMTNLKVHLERCKFSPSLKESLTKKNNQREEPNKETNSSDTDDGDKNVEAEFKDDSEIIT
jgi:hypothetical protein